MQRGDFMSLAELGDEETIPGFLRAGVPSFFFVPSERSEILRY